MKSLKNFILETKENTISNKEEYIDAAKSKFKAVFGDKLDIDRMNKIIDGLLVSHDDLVKNNQWGELIGILNQSFAK